MGRATLRPVLRSDELPRPRLWDASGRLRREAIAGTLSYPQIRRVRVGRADLLVARLATGEVVAFAPRCPHQQTSLEEATIFEGNLRCPRHNYVYDPRTGENILPTREARPGTLWKLKPGFLTTHPVEERDGWVWVGEEANPPPPAYDPRREQPPPGARRLPPPPPAAAPTPGSAEPPAPPSVPEAEPLAADLWSEFELQLLTEVVPGYLWRVEVFGGAVEMISQTFEPGPPFVYRVRLAASSPGTATVRCLYTKPWGTAPRQVRVFAVTVSGGMPNPGRPDPGGGEGPGATGAGAAGA